MGMRSGAKDFGYTFVKTEEEDHVVLGGDKDVETGVGSDADAKASPQQQPHAAAEKPYTYTPLKRDRYGSGGNGASTLSGQDDDRNGDVLSGLLISAGVCCCCIMAIMFVAGAILLVCAHYYNTGTNDPNSSGKSSSLALAGSILLILGGVSCLLGHCACCFTCAASTCVTTDSVFGASEHYQDAHTEVKVQFRRLNDRYEKAEDALDAIHLDVVVGMKEIREAHKKQAQKRKEEEKKKKEELGKQLKRDLEAGLTIQTIRRNYRPIAFLIHFDGDAMVTGMELLRKQVSIIVNCGRAGVDQAIVVVTSPGGAVSSYGLAASQLVRIRKAGIKLVVCVDTVAASGGYMMASVGDQIYAAPFAMIGSIGVVTHVPNLSRFLDKHDIDAFLFTAGKHKRTVDIIGDVTEEGKAKLKEELDDIHAAFKDHVALARPLVRENMEEIATGEYWLAVHAKQKGLVDEIMTSDEYLESISQENEIIEIVEKKRKSPWSGFHAAAKSVKGVVDEMTVCHNGSPAPMARA